MRVSIRTLQVPTRTPGAFTPTLTYGAQPVTTGQLQAAITGAPGTVRVPSPRPAALSDGELGGPYNQPSSVAPNWFLPSVYFYRIGRSLLFPGRLLSDNVLPVPAKAVTRVATQSQYRTRIGGRTATSSPRPFTVWPTYNGKSF